MHHFGSFGAAREEVGLRRPRYRQKWTRELLLDELRKIERSGIRVSQEDMTVAGYAALVVAIQKYFGGLVRAREEAGIATPPRAPTSERWSEADVIRSIRTARRRGESLAFSKVDRRLLRAAVHIFGSWREAVEAVGIPYARVALRQHSLSDDELLDIVRDLHRRFPTITLKDLHRQQRHGNIIRKRFGSIDRAVKLAGIADWPVRQRPTRALSKESVTLELCRRARTGLSCSYATLRAEAPALITGADRHFGGLAAAVRAAGVPDGRIAHRERRRASVLERLRQRARRGLSMERVDAARSDPNLVGRATYHFGSWAAAVGAARAGDA